MTQLSKNFKRSEFACKCGCGFDSVDAELIFVLQGVSDYFAGASVTVTSGDRCDLHNERIGGSKDSQHLYARAGDIVVAGFHADEVADYLEWKYPNKYGIGRYVGRTHIDTKTGPARRWDLR